VTQTLRGTIVNWNDERGFGFIRPQRGGKELFFHVSDVTSTRVRPREKMNVSYRGSTDEKGRPCASDIRLFSLEVSAEMWPLLIAVVFMLALGVACWIGVFSFWVLVVYLIMSLVTLLVYRSDKVRAENGSWRTPEKMLHLLELAGGWPGALVAQWRFRHKSRKASYQIAFWLIVAVNLVLLVLLGTAGL
jgi:uncharacterized membrane protein YsdA (DUF1294 family)/cold shock CspA family protein